MDDSIADKIIVLDDDPTGVQTVHDVYVYTDWTKNSLRSAFLDSKKMFFILTNSRSLTEEETIKIHTEICRNIVSAAQETGQSFIIVSRSDSTLRGHYPSETEIIKNVIEAETNIIYDGEIFYPFFLEGGRYTLDNIHFVKENDKLIPVHRTEFSQDLTFGFQTSYLPAYIEEKTKGRYRADDIVCISMKDLRSCNINKIAAQLMEVHNFNKVVVNSADYADVKVFCTALAEVMKKGKNFIFRTAASFTKIIGQVTDSPLLSKNQIEDIKNHNGGLIIIGSHVKKTSEQLEELRKLEVIKSVEFNQHLVVKPGEIEKEVIRVADEMNTLIAEGNTVVIYTRRERIDFKSENKEAELQIAAEISNSITDIVRKLEICPKFLIAKGGITSSDIGTKGLSVKKALVAGQVKQGIPVWILGDESKFPGMPYIIFPGNVGSRSTLKDIVEELI